MTSPVFVLFLVLAVTEPAHAAAEVRRIFGDIDVVYRGARSESIYRLVALPERFDGQLIQAAGWLVIDNETAELCASSQDGRYATLENCVDLGFGDAAFKASYREFLDINGRHARILGRVKTLQDCPSPPLEPLDATEERASLQAECTTKASLVGIKFMVVSWEPEDER